MSLEGRIEDGRVVFDQPVLLPNGTPVRVEPLASAPRVVSGTGNWKALEEAAKVLTDYDFDAWREQRAFDARQSEPGRR